MQTNWQRQLGSLFMAGIPGLTLDTETARLIKDYGVCNFIIFKRNTEKGADMLARLCSDLAACCMEVGLGMPLIAVDQEGGRVQRLGPPFWPALVSNSAAASGPEPEMQVKKQAQTAAKTLNAVGINVNLAPCLDLAPFDASGVLVGRSYGPDAVSTAGLGAHYIKTFQDEGVLACAKHFPGIGMVQSDPHFDLPVINAGMDEIEREMSPFCAAIDAGVALLMTSHVIFNAIDIRPATFSPAVVRLARDRGFDGVMITDDLEMAGATVTKDTANAALLAFEVGHDMLLICHRQAFVVDALKLMENAVKTGSIDLRKVERSLFRINEAKRKIQRV